MFFNGFLKVVDFFIMSFKSRFFYKSNLSNHLKFIEPACNCYFTPSPGKLKIRKTEAGIKISFIFSLTTFDFSPCLALFFERSFPNPFKVFSILLQEWMGKLASG